ncbi:MAG: J domain-containing protein [Alphaproteobacteria bacterium]|nr:J domain-containing protein [Alphaproteobacteria bacterium]
MAQDPYTLLGVAKTASADEIKKAYRKLVKQLHPDLHPGDKQAAERFKEVASAYDIVGDETKRAKFDKGEIDASGAQKNVQQFYREYANRGGARQYRSDAGFEDLGAFSDLFSDLFGQKAARGASMRGRNVHFRLEVDFVTAALGGQQRITLPDGKQLGVTIPEGVADGQTLRLKGLGHPGRGDAAAGDALIEIHVLPSPIFERKGDALLSELAITIDEAILGAKVEAPTLSGRVMITVPKGASSGQSLRLKAKGFRGKHGVVGDQLIKLKIVMPKAIDEELETFMKGWRERHAYNPRAE